jgi:hypothetical protein
MANMSESQGRRITRSLTWAYRSPTRPDNPVQRWLGHRQAENRLQEKHRPRASRRLIVRLAI